MPQSVTTNKTIDERIADLLQGAIDPHVHSGPSIAPRGVDHLELLEEYSAAGFAAVVTKDHDYSGVMTAALISKHHPELRTKIYSSIVLNNVVAGFNPYAVEHTAAMGGKVVWMPTLAAENHLRWEKTSNWVHPASTQKMRPGRRHPGSRQQRGGAGRRQGSAGYRRQERHGAGERPSSRERDVAGLRGGQAAWRDQARADPP